MIPKITQQAPNIAERYWCSTCGAAIPKYKPLSNELSEWKFCSICGEPIEWDKAEPVPWEEKLCDTCGCKMIWKRPGIPGSFMASSCYIGGDTCHDCMSEYCNSTNCLGCNRGHYPDCKHLYLKKTETEEAE